MSSDLLVAAGEPEVQRGQLLTHLQQHGAHRVRQPDVFDQLGQGAEKPVRRTRDHHTEFSQQTYLRYLASRDVDWVVGANADDGVRDSAASHRAP
ncbi:hypothetical protein [Caballeronia ptereochthonis]|uniref:hypothetical protein n=1 Tax=Caballeronia ptereochthonis TaxID=1777144 RepID=UPI000AEA6436|nr:hypothetical protein [Caballeronia ptereochthonis]